MEFSEKKINEHGTFKPPMAKELSIIRRNRNRFFPLKQVKKIFHLLLTIKQEISCMCGRFLFCCLETVRFFVFRRPSDSIIFNPNVFSNSTFVKIRLHVIIFQIPSYVSVKFAIEVIPGVSLFGTPNLLRTPHISPKRSHSR